MNNDELFHNRAEVKNYYIYIFLFEGKSNNSSQSFYCVHSIPNRRLEELCNQILEIFLEK